jgi:ribA/ribD-fused uncharacterized protein
MRSREDLIAFLDGGGSVDFFFFWGHTQKEESVVDKSCLSQWFPRAFVLDGIRYATAEHYMMAEKARCFRDERAASAVLEARTPAEAKALGRTVRNYDDRAWSAARVDAVVRGNVAKFSQHADLKRFLLSTHDRVIVEASPRDRIWGIGMGASNPDARIPARWRGQNLLGFALMQARSEIALRGEG